MKRLTFWVLLCVVPLMLFNRCSKKQDCPVFWGYQVPLPLYFRVVQNNQRLPDSVLDHLKLSYNKDSKKQYISDFGRAGAEGYGLGVLLTREIGLRSGDDKIKDYYLEFPNGEVDTLYVDYKSLTPCEAVKSGSCCLYLLKSVKFNRVEASYDPSIEKLPVYLFTKP